MIPDPVMNPSGYANYLNRCEINAASYAWRNDLAKTAMQALLSTGNYSCQGSGSGSLIYNCQEIARCCYNLADAMMAEATKQ